MRVVAPYTHFWTTLSGSTRRLWRDRVFSHEILSPFTQLPLTALYGRAITSYAHYLHTFGWFVACGGSTYSLPDYKTASIHSKIVARLRFQSRDSISRRPTATLHSLYSREIPSYALTIICTRIWLVHCVWQPAPVAHILPPPLPLFLSYGVPRNREGER